MKNSEFDKNKGVAGRISKLSLQKSQSGEWNVEAKATALPRKEAPYQEEKGMQNELVTPKDQEWSKSQRGEQCLSCDFYLFIIPLKYPQSFWNFFSRWFFTTLNKKNKEQILRKTQTLTRN